MSAASLSPISASVLSVSSVISESSVACVLSVFSVVSGISVLSVSAGISEFSSVPVFSVVSEIWSSPLSPASFPSAFSESPIASVLSVTSGFCVSSVISVSFCSPAAYTTCSAGTAVTQRLNTISQAAILFPAWCLFFILFSIPALLSSASQVCA